MRAKSENGNELQMGVSPLDYDFAALRGLTDRRHCEWCTLSLFRKIPFDVRAATGPKADSPKRQNTHSLRVVLWPETVIL